MDSENVHVFAAYYHWQRANVTCAYSKKELSQSCREVRFLFHTDTLPTTVLQFKIHVQFKICKDQTSALELNLPESTIYRVDEYLRCYLTN